jgi:eukaryotic-like serine/threonine-protein kinase
VMLFEMLAGRPPFVAEGVGELFAKHMLEEPPPLLDFAPNTPPHMAAAIMNSLQKEPRDRFQSMDEFRKALVGEVKLAPAPTRSTAVRSSSLPSTQTLSPKTSTTLSSASSQIDDALPSPSGRNWKVMAAVGVVAAIGGIALLVVPKSHDKPAPAPQAALPAPAPSPVAPPPPAAPVAKTVTLRFEAEPAGAHVFAKKDGKDLGEIPVELQVAKGGQPADYLFRLAGYREVALSAKPNADRTLHVSLEKLASPAPTASETKHRGPAHHGGGKHAKSPVDEDGLATPSF